MPIGMNKLQLYIYKSLRGFKSVRNINPAESVRQHISDLRNALEILDYDPGEKYLFYLLSYISSGSFFTILRTIPDKPLDHLATTIFIPNGMQISRDELMEIVQRITRMVSNPEVSADELNELHDLFAKEYPVMADAPAMAPSEGNEYAFSFYGGETGRKLEDFFGDKMFQSQFLKYAGVVLVDADLSVPVNATDLTDSPLCPSATLFPPEPADGFNPYIYKCPFNKPYRASLGETVEVVWHRNGFEDIIQSVAVTDSEQTVESETFDTSRKTITPATFLVTSRSDRQPLDDVDVIVNGVEIKDEHTFSLEELKNADVIVRAKGYPPFQATYDLAASSRPHIQLSEPRRIYRFELPVKSSELGAPIRFEIHTKRKLTESPLEGYSLLDEIKEGAGKCNYLEYTRSNVSFPIRQGILYLCAALIIGLFVGWLIWGGSKGGSQEVVEEDVVEMEISATATTDSKKTENVSVSATQSVVKKEEKQSTVKNASADKAVQAGVTAASLTYLDGNSKWSRSEMEKLPGLAGLFDDMNNFRMERIVDVWAPKLKKSKRFEKVVFHAQESMRKKIFKPSGTYCTDASDNVITVQSYLNRIDPAKK